MLFDINDLTQQYCSHYRYKKKKNCFVTHNFPTRQRSKLDSRSFSRYKNNSRDPIFISIFHSACRVHLECSLALTPRVNLSVLLFLFFWPYVKNAVQVSSTKDDWETGEGGKEREGWRLIISGHVYAASTNRKREHILPTGRPNERNETSNGAACTWIRWLLNWMGGFDGHVSKENSTQWVQHRAHRWPTWPATFRFLFLRVVVIDARGGF